MPSPVSTLSLAIWRILNPGIFCQTTVLSRKISGVLRSRCAPPNLKMQLPVSVQLTTCLSLSLISPRSSRSFILLSFLDILEGDAPYPSLVEGFGGQQWERMSVPLFPPALCVLKVRPPHSLHVVYFNPCLYPRGPGPVLLWILLPATCVQG